MKFKPGDDVVIVEDTFDFGLPMNTSAKVLRIDRNMDQAQNYCIRVPAKKESWWVTEQDIEFASVVNAEQANSLIHNHLLDLSLDTKNEALFHLVISNHKRDNAKE